MDDERTIVDVLSYAFATKGHATVGVNTAEEAASALSAGTYDIVILDQVLPGVTGMQSLGALSALTRAPIYLMSGQTDLDTRRDALLLGATGFLPKPLDLSAIFAIIEALPERPT